MFRTVGTVTTAFATSIVYNNTKRGNRIDRTTRDHRQRQFYCLGDVVVVFETLTYLAHNFASTLFVWFTTFGVVSFWCKVATISYEIYIPAVGN